MEKRYYFRGLGLGIIVTAVIMGIALSGGSRQGKMTDEEVITRAKELGMIEDSSLLASTDNKDSDKKENEKNEAEEDMKTPVKLDVAVAEQKPAETPEADAESSADTKPDTDSTTDTKPASDTKPAADTNEMTKQDDDTTAPASQTTSSASSTTPAAVKSITIVSGDGSYTIAKKLADAGVVSSAASFDTFLCQNGYDKRLRTGTFQIPADADDEQIARIVTGQE